MPYTEEFTKGISVAVVRLYPQRCTASAHADRRKKGTNPEIDSYSAFFDNHRLVQTDLHHWLQNQSIKKLFICGLATDYCVKFSVLDALHLGYEVVVLKSAVMGVNLNPQDSELAFMEMEQAGAIFES